MRSKTLLTSPWNHDFITEKGISIMDTETVQWLVELITKNKCSGVELANGWLQVLFDDKRLVIQCAWRLVHNGEIALSIGDDTDSVESSEIAVRLLCEHRACSLSVTTPFHDIEVHFDNETAIQAYANSSRYENWYFSGGPQEMVVAGPNTLWSCFKAHDKL